MAGARRELFGYLAETARILASPSRIELLDLLVQGERSVEALAEAAHLSVANASQHLRQLLRSGIVRRQRRGTSAFYAIADDRLLDLMAALRTLTERNVAAAAQALDRGYGGWDSEHPISRDALIKRMRQRAVTLIDVRPVVEFNAAHIPGALSIPVSVLPTKLRSLPRRRDVVAYCRGPYCVFAYKAMEILRPRGFRAWRLDGGFTEWRRAGLPLAKEANENDPNRAAVLA
jgi:rhodanese-related sulfurtransferase/DNA-binding transcriptional ArsR family regulator